MQQEEVGRGQYVAVRNLDLLQFFELPIFHDSSQS